MAVRPTIGLRAFPPRGLSGKVEKVPTRVGGLLRERRPREGASVGKNSLSPSGGKHS